MTDNEIIKALLYCADEGTTCDKCILYDASDEDCECSRMLKRKAAVLIDRQRAEIEALQAEFAERLKAEMENCESSNEDYYYLIGKPFVDEIAEEMAGDAE